MMKTLQGNRKVCINQLRSAVQRAVQRAVQYLDSGTIDLEFAVIAVYVIDHLPRRGHHDVKGA